MSDLEKLKREARQIEKDLELCYAGDAPNYVIREGEADLDDVYAAIAALKNGDNDE